MSAVAGDSDGGRAVTELDAVAHVHVVHPANFQILMDLAVKGVAI
jgi:hypothetical protein